TKTLIVLRRTMSVCISLATSARLAAGHYAFDDRRDHQHHGPADAAAGDAAEHRADVESALRHSEIHHLQNRAADAAAEDAGHRIADRPQAFVFHRGPGDVAADRAADQPDQPRDQHGSIHMHLTPVRTTTLRKAGPADSRTRNESRNSRCSSYLLFLL